VQQPGTTSYKDAEVSRLDQVRRSSTRTAASCARPRPLVPRLLLRSCTDVRSSRRLMLGRTDVAVGYCRWRLNVQERHGAVPRRRGVMCSNPPLLL